MALVHPQRQACFLKSVFINLSATFHIKDGSHPCEEKSYVHPACDEIYQASSFSLPATLKMYEEPEGGQTNDSSSSNTYPHSPLFLCKYRYCDMWACVMSCSFRDFAHSDMHVHLVIHTMNLICTRFLLLAFYVWIHFWCVAIAIDCLETVSRMSCTWKSQGYYKYYTSYSIWPLFLW